MLNRYSVAEVTEIFSDRSKYQKWLQIEICLIRFLVNKGYLPRESAESLISQFSPILDNLSQIIEEEKKTRHDVVAFINILSSSTNEEDRKWLHYGLTSSDLVDTANSLMIREVNEIIMGRLRELSRTLQSLSIKYKNLYHHERDDYIFKSLGRKFANYYVDFQDLYFQLQHLRPQIECASASGSVGTFSYLGYEFQEYLAEELGLFAGNLSTQVLSRQRYSSYLGWLNMMGKLINRFSLELRIYARTELNKITEGFYSDQVGSSSMPHKRNPISLENLCGLSRLLSGYFHSSIGNVPLWLERDISHSSVDRVTLLDATTLAVLMITRFNDILKNMVVNEGNFRRKLTSQEQADSYEAKLNTLYSNIFG